ncbi:MAG: hypothetical protein KGS61_03860 [Verrucomicrobia bacterium]|nr:hypothetical protein [Verrucomicrobiota bacterium]
MKPGLSQLIQAKRAWSEPMSPEDKAAGFQGWYVSKNLPHCDTPGRQQYVSYRLADSMPAERRSEWEGLLQLEGDREKLRRIETFVRYIENNPVKAGFVRAPEAWPWSSARYRGEVGAVVPTLTHPRADRATPALLHEGTSVAGTGRPRSGESAAAGRAADISGAGATDF